MAATTRARPKRDPVKGMWRAGFALLALGAAAWAGPPALAGRVDAWLETILAGCGTAAPWIHAAGALLCVLAVLLRKPRAGMHDADDDDEHTGRRSVPPAAGSRNSVPPSVVPGYLDSDREPVVVAEGDPSGPAREPQSAWGEQVFGDIEWRRFEAVCEALLPEMPQRIGALRCVHGRAQAVDVQQLRDFHAAMAARGLGRGTFATSATFTAEAMQFARANGIRALDGAALLDLIVACPPHQQLDLLATAYEGDYWRPSCAGCGAKLHERPGGEASCPACSMTATQPAALLGS